jgi:predicted nucleotidyltransferase
VSQAWIFGSYIAGGFGPESDIDLMLVVETDEPFQIRAFAFEDLVDLGPRFDILVYTPDEFLRLTGDPSPGFWRSAAQTMRRIL